MLFLPFILLALSLSVWARARSRFLLAGLGVVENRVAVARASTLGYGRG